MDMIKKEPQLDAFAAEINCNLDTEEKKPLLEVVSTPTSSTPIPRMCAVNHVSTTPEECAPIMTSRQSTASQGKSSRKRSPSGSRGKYSAAKLSRLTEYESEVFLLKQELEEAKMRHDMEMQEAQIAHDEQMYRAQMEMFKAKIRHDEEIYQLQKAKMLLEMEILKEKSCYLHTVEEEPIEDEVVAEMVADDCRQSSQNHLRF
ncbi:uncharacterized protein [Periplaneta americana]|uniref:uncharacterized protein isoform X2 n=1 Tax=Periplaneta americana TaxID=6978 RepID=UPI0037E7E139